MALDDVVRSKLLEIQGVALEDGTYSNGTMYMNFSMDGEHAIHVEVEV